MPNPPNGGERPPTCVISLLSLLVATLAFLRDVVVAIWNHRNEVDRIVAWCHAVLNPTPLSWWAFNICFASASQLGCAALVLYRSRQELHGGSDQQQASYRFYASDLAYYAALPLLARPVGQAQVGHNPGLEIINAYLGYALLCLAGAVGAARNPARSRRYGRVGAWTAVALAVIVDFAPFCAQRLGLCTQNAALAYVSTGGTTFFVAVCGTVLLIEACRASAAPVAIAALALYCLGLWARMAFTLEPALWDSAFGLAFFISMAGKFAAFGVVRTARPTHTHDSTTWTSILDWFARWFERRAHSPCPHRARPLGSSVRAVRPSVVTCRNPRRAEPSPGPCPCA